MGFLLRPPTYKLWQYIRFMLLMIPLTNEPPPISTFAPLAHSLSIIPQDLQTQQHRPPHSLRSQLPHRSYLDILWRVLASISASLPSHIHDMNHALRLFNSFIFPLDSSPFLFTMDINSLYTAIPHQEDLLTLNHFIGICSNHQLATTTLLRSAELILSLNWFSIAGEFYY